VTNETNLAKRCAIIAVVVIVTALFAVLAACEFPTPTSSPLPTPILPTPRLRPGPQQAIAVEESGTVTGTVEVWWDSPLVPTGFVTLYTGIDLDTPTAPGEYVVYYACQGNAIACAGYPAMRTVTAPTAEEACAVTMTLMLDFEARHEGSVFSAATKTGGPIISAREPGTGQFDGTISWRWKPLLPKDFVGVVEVWQRGRWVDEGLPDIVIPYGTNGALHTPDGRGFFLVGTFEVGTEEYRLYFPIVARRGWRP
jgi:hypothetical protein